MPDPVEKQFCKVREGWETAKNNIKYDLAITIVSTDPFPFRSPPGARYVLGKTPLFLSGSVI